MSQPIQINRQAVQADIDVFQVKIEMQKAMIEAHHEKAKHDRLLVKAILDGLFSTDRIVSYHSWATAHKKEEEAHSAILQFDLMQMESQVQIREAMLREGDKNVIEPGGFRA
jgi:hypothetical protein